MQQPDYRDQSETEGEGPTEENSQSESNEAQVQETNQLEQQEEDKDDALVSSTKWQSFTLRHLTDILALTMDKMNYMN